MTCGRGRSWLRAKRALHPRAQDRRIALTSRLHIGVDRGLVSRALQLPERGGAGQIEQRVEPGRFRKCRPGGVEAPFPAQRHGPQRGGAGAALVRGQGQRRHRSRQDRLAVWHALGCASSRRRRRPRPPAMAPPRPRRPSCMASARTESCACRASRLLARVASRSAHQSLPGRIEAHQGWLGDHHGVASLHRLCQRVAGGTASWRRAGAGFSARSCRLCGGSGSLQRSHRTIGAVRTQARL